ncbi:MAG: tRNA pseudouridine(55) synthase TruB [Bacilli bacterium]
MDGILLVNKPQGISSREVVNRVSKYLKVKKVGHTGTLDPLAQGLLILCIGKATKIASLISNYDKEYIAKGIMGIETDTLDLEGKVLFKEELPNLTNEQFKKILKTFIGEIKQEVPKYSALKIKGKRLYEYARLNKEVKLPIRDVNIKRLELISLSKNQNQIKEFVTFCQVSKGTYIRSLIKDIGLKTGSRATMTFLIRIKQGSFNINDSYSLENIKQGNYKLIKIIDVLDYPKIKVEDRLLKQVKNGGIIKRFFEEEKAIIINKNKEPIAIYQTYEKDNNKVKPYIMF